MKTCNLSRVSLVLACALLLPALSRSAQAQAENQAAARALFEEGRQLMKAGQHAAACPKLEAASRLYSSAGILLNLGDCYESIGRTASAWTVFGEASSVAKRTSRPDDAEEAIRRQNALQPALARLVIHVPHPMPGLTVNRGGDALAPAAWGAALPVDPGPVVISAEASGFNPWNTSVVATAKRTVAVEVPALEAVESAAVRAPVPVALSPMIPERDPPPPERSHALGGWLIGGGVAVGLAGGTLMWLESRKASDARTHHDEGAYDATKAPWALGLAGAIAGGLSAATGAYLLMSGGADDQRTGAWLSPVVGVGLAGVSVGANW